MTPLQEIRQEARAIRMGWDLTPEKRAAVIDRLYQVLVNPKSKPRAVFAVCRAFIAIEAQNQKDQLAVYNRPNRERFHEIAQRLGIDLSKIE